MSRLRFRNITAEALLNFSLVKAICKRVCPALISVSRVCPALSIAKNRIVLVRKTFRKRKIPLILLKIVIAEVGNRLF